MRLLVTTPMAIITDVNDVDYVRAEDETGAFGIRPGHAEFITVLTVSVITWRNRSGSEHHLAVRGGVLSVKDGSLVEIATRGAVGEDTLRELGNVVLERLREEMQAEEESRTSSARMQLETIRRLQRYIRSSSRPATGFPHASTGSAPGEASAQEGQ